MIKSIQNFSKKRIVAATAWVALGLVGGMGAASAAPVSFGYDAGGGFTIGSAAAFPSPVNYTGFQSTLDPTPASIRASVEWGTPVGVVQSAATINQIDAFTNSPGVAADLNGSVTINGARAGLGYLVHHNHVIGQAFTAPVSLSYNLWLNDGGAAGEVFKWHGDFEIQVTETPNLGGGNCCDDTFSFTKLLSSDATEFSYLGQKYNVDISGFYTAFTGGTFVGNQPFLSVEDGDTAGYIQFSVNTVPEPGSMALLGMGLLGVGAIRRRRQAGVI